MACTIRNGYACFNGTEIWNVCRTMHYVDTLLPNHGFSLDFNKDSGGDFCCGCCTGTFTTPTADEAPWYNANVPESADFYGFFPTVIDGLTFANPTFRPTAPTRDGAVIASRNDPGRTIDIQTLAFGASCEAVTWGVHWLNAIIESSGGLAWEDCCIDFDAAESPNDDLFFLGRNIPCVSTTAGINAEPFRPDITGDYVWDVSYTLTAERSWIYEAPVTLFNDVVHPGGNETNCVYYTSECLDGAVIEVFVDRKENTEDGSITFRANPAYFMGDSPPVNAKNFRHGIVVNARRGDSVLVDPRCLGTYIVGPTGAPLYTATDVSLTRNAYGPYPVLSYGERWWICVTVPDNGGGPVDLCIRAWPRRRV